MVTWTCVPWSDFGRDDLYDVLTLRQIVFVVERSCVYLDCDGVDRKARHLLGRDEGGDLAAYARLIPPMTTFEEASIGRVVTHPWSRHRGLGRMLMAEAIARVVRLFGAGPIRIGAQRYLERFYIELGFVVAGEPYVEDGIPHVEMLLRTPKSYL
jgi:ElaA protein